MNKELSHSDATTTQEVLTTNYQILKNLLIKNNSKDLLNIEEGSVTNFGAVTRIMCCCMVKMMKIV